MSTASFQDIQYKASSGQVNLDQAQGIVECFVAGIGNKDSVGDVCATGAFAKSLLRRKPRVVWGHNWNDPIGKVLEIYEVPPSDPRLPAKMRAAGIGGLYAKVQFNLNSEKGREAFANVAFFGEEQEWSIGYKTIRAQFDQSAQANILYEVELYEVSPVLHGANQLTGTISVKNAEKGGTAVMPMPSGPEDMPEGDIQRKLKEELEARIGSAVKVESVEDGVVMYSRDDDDEKGGMYKCRFHHDGGVFMFGRPERIQMPMAPAMPKPQQMPTGMPSKPMEPVTGVIVVPQALPQEGESPKPVAGAGQPSGKPKLVQEEADLAEALIKITKRHGKFDEDGSGVWAGYKPAAENPVAKIGVKCSNCVLYQGDGVCKIIAQKVEDEGKCRFAVIPDNVVVASPIKKQEVDSAKQEEEVKWLQDIEAKHPEEFLSGDLRMALKRKRDAVKPSVKMVPIQEFSSKSLDDQQTFYYLPVDKKDAFEVKQTIDPIIDYYRTDAYVEDGGIIFTAGVNKDFADAIDNAVKALGRNLAGKLRRGGRGLSARFDPNAWDGDNDGIVQEGTPFERPAIPGVNDFSTRGRVDARAATRAYRKQGGSTRRGNRNQPSKKPSAKPAQSQRVGRDDTRLMQDATPFDRPRREGISSGRSLTRHSDGTANPRPEEVAKRDAHEKLIDAWEKGMGMRFTPIPRQPSEKGGKFTPDWLRGRELGYNDAKARWAGKGNQPTPKNFNENQRESTNYASWFMNVAGQLGQSRRNRGNDNKDQNDGMDAGMQEFLQGVMPRTQTRETQDAIEATLRDAGLSGDRRGLSSGRKDVYEEEYRDLPEELKEYADIIQELIDSGITKYDAADNWGDWVVDNSLDFVEKEDVLEQTPEGLPSQESLRDFMYERDYSPESSDYYRDYIDLSLEDASASAYLAALAEKYTPSEVRELIEENYRGVGGDRRGLSSGAMSTGYKDEQAYKDLPENVKEYADAVQEAIDAGIINDFDDWEDWALNNSDDIVGEEAVYKYINGELPTDDELVEYARNVDWGLEGSGPYGSERDRIPSWDEIFETYLESALEDAPTGDHLAAIAKEFKPSEFREFIGLSSGRSGMSSGGVGEGNYASAYGDIYNPARRKPDDYAQIGGKPHRPRWDGKSGKWVYDVEDDGTGATRVHDWDTPETPAEDHDAFWRDWVRIPYQELLAENPPVAGEKSPILSRRLLNLAREQSSPYHKGRGSGPFEGRFFNPRYTSSAERSRALSSDGIEALAIAEAIAKDFSYSDLTIEELAERFDATPLQIHDILDSVAKEAPNVFNGGRRARDIPAPSEDVERLRRERLELAQERDAAIKTNEDIARKRGKLIAEHPSTRRAKKLERLRLAKQDFRLYTRGVSSRKTAKDDITALRSDDIDLAKEKFKELFGGGVTDEDIVKDGKRLFNDNDFTDGYDREYGPLDDYIKEEEEEYKRELIGEYGLIERVMGAGEYDDEDEAWDALVYDYEIEDIGDLLTNDELSRISTDALANRIESGLYEIESAESAFEKDDPALEQTEQQNGSEALSLNKEVKNAVAAFFQDVDVPERPRKSTLRGLSSGRRSGDSDEVQAENIAAHFYNAVGMSSGRRWDERGIDYRQGDPETAGFDLERVSQRSDDLGANFRHLLREVPEGDPVIFEYRGKLRQVRPQNANWGSASMKVSRDGAIYFGGIDAESGEFRTFRLDRINGLIQGAEYGWYDSGWDGSGFNDELPRALRGMSSGRIAEAQRRALGGSRAGDNRRGLSSGMVPTREQLDAMRFRPAGQRNLDRINADDPDAIERLIDDVVSIPPQPRRSTFSGMGESDETDRAIGQNQLDKLQDAINVHNALLDAYRQKFPERNIQRLSDVEGDMISDDPATASDIEDMLGQLEGYVDTAWEPFIDSSNRMTDIEQERERATQTIEDLNNGVSELEADTRSIPDELENGDITIEEAQARRNRNYQRIEDYNNEIDDLRAELRNLDADEQVARIFAERFDEAQALMNSRSRTARDNRRARLSSGRRAMEDAMDGRAEFEREAMLDAEERDISPLYDSFMERPAAERARALVNYRKETGQAPNPDSASFRRWIAGLENDLIMREDNSAESARDASRGLSSGRLRNTGRKSVAERMFDDMFDDFYGGDGTFSEESDAQLARRYGTDEATIARVRPRVQRDIDQAIEDIQDYYASLPEPTDEELQAEADDYARRGFSSGASRLPSEIAKDMWYSFKGNLSKFDATSDETLAERSGKSERVIARNRPLVRIELIASELFNDYYKNVDDLERMPDDELARKYNTDEEDAYIARQNAIEDILAWMEDAGRVRQGLSSGRNRKKG